MLNYCINIIYSNSDGGNLELRFPLKKLLLEILNHMGENLLFHPKVIKLIKLFLKKELLNKLYCDNLEEVKLSFKITEVIF